MTTPGAMVVGEMAVRDLVRRRVALVIMLALPLSLYVVRHDAPGQSIRGLVFGISWSISTIALFAALSAREVEPRLRLAGWTDRILVGGRLGGLLFLGFALCGIFLVLVATTSDIDDVGFVALDFVVTAVVAVTFGSAVGAVLHRELEGALALFLVAAVQAVVNPFDQIAKAIPFWSSRELATYAVDGPAQASIVGALAHAAIVVALSVAVLAFVHRRHAGARRTAS